MIQALFSRSKMLAQSVYQSITAQLTNGSPKILLFLNLPQDLDMLLPLAIRLHHSDKHQVKVAVSDKAYSQSPRIEKLLTAAGIKPEVVRHKAVVAGLQPQLIGIQAVVTASESTANAHRGPHTLTQRANRKGVLTYTMQHGFENVGLNYFDEEYPVGAILFASQAFFTWAPVEQLPAETPAETLKKCIAVGCPKFVDAPGLTAQMPGQPAGDSPANRQRQRLVVVFENLHWGRYSDDYRQRFLQDLEATAAACLHVTFLVKPHHTGLWLTKRYQGKLPDADNLIIADPKAPEWEAFTAPALIEIADAVITTPSTVAVDAVRAGCPVAVVAYDMDLPNYEPLLLLRCEADWQAVASRANRDNGYGISEAQAFKASRLLPGDAVQKIMDRISADLSVSASATLAACR